MDCNSRGRSPPASTEGEADPSASPAREQWRAGTGRICPKEAGGSALWALISTKVEDWPYNLDTSGQAKGLADIRGRFTDSGKEVVYRGKSDAYLSCWGN